MKPRALRPGETVGVAAISGPIRAAKLESGLGALLAAGHPVELAPNVHSRRAFFAGDDQERADGLNAFIRRRDIPAIFFARGGWGAARVLDRLDLAGLRSRPRVLAGYSDLTTLFMALQRPPRWVPYRYGPFVFELGTPRAYHRASWRDALALPGRELLHPFGRSRILRQGTGQGVLIGGCLSMLISLLGTRHDFSWDGCILFWEDLNEPPYRIDRMLQQLRQTGKLARLQGLIVGKLKGCEAPAGTPALSLAEMLLEATEGTRYPIVTDFPCGHVDGKRTLLMGAPAALSTSRRRLAITVR